mmetsp:Transcript_50404/g.122921  ORF Transcript_50404/g.122921 Transcript_50404/m.122921 type:complete len:257 (-) Transcript_50404:803-1573(-)
MISVEKVTGTYSPAADSVTALELLSCDAFSDVSFPCVGLCAAPLKLACFLSTGLRYLWSTMPVSTLTVTLLVSETIPSATSAACERFRRRRRHTHMHTTAYATATDPHASSAHAHGFPFNHANPPSSTSSSSSLCVEGHPSFERSLWMQPRPPCHAHRNVSIGSRSEKRPVSCMAAIVRLDTYTSSVKHGVMTSSVPTSVGCQCRPPVWHGTELTSSHPNNTLASSIAAFPDPGRESGSDWKPSVCRSSWKSMFLM